MSAEYRLQQLRDILRDAQSCGDEELAEQIRADIANEFPDVLDGDIPHLCQKAEELIAIVVIDATGGPGLAEFRGTILKRSSARIPELSTPDGAIFFIACPDIPKDTPRRLISKNVIPGVYTEWHIGKRAAEILNWAQQFGNNTAN